jgi:hypothetical protein
MRILPQPRVIPYHASSTRRLRPNRNGRVVRVSRLSRLQRNLRRYIRERISRPRMAPDVDMVDFSEPPPLEDPSQSPPQSPPASLRDPNRDPSLNRICFLIYRKRDRVAELCITQQRNYNRTISKRTGGRLPDRVEDIWKFQGDGIRLNQILTEHMRGRFHKKNRTVYVANDGEFDELVAEVRACICDTICRNVT